MDETATTLLMIVARMCSADRMRPEDWQHVYSFAIYSHRRALHTSPRTIKDFLTNHGCSAQKAQFLSAECQRFRDLLQQYDSLPALSPLNH
jgi:hypothetical protein